MTTVAVRFVEAFPLKDLVLNPQNTRGHAERDIQAIVRSIEHWGFTNPIIVRDGTNIVVAGHGRVEAARQLKLQTVPVLFKAFQSDDDAIAYGIADNRTAELSDWDRANLKDALMSLEGTSYDITLTGFRPEDLEAMLDWDARHGADPDATPEPPVHPVTQPGDLWILGDHRVLCGDCTDPATLPRLMGSQQATLVFTDPPYGVSYASQSGKHDLIANDELQHSELTEFLWRAFRNVMPVTDDEAAFYIWHASATRGEFGEAMAAAGLTEQQYLIWVKPAAVLGHDDYQWAHEPCFYAGKSGSRPRWYGGRAQQTVWRFSPVTPRGIVASIGKGLTLVMGGQTVHLTTQGPKTKKQRTMRIPDGRTLLVDANPGDQSTAWEISRDAKPEHPTQKPTALAQRAIRNSSQYGEIVLDLFLGSGSTLIAAEQMGRRCYGTELKPEYVDLIVQRWQTFTGKTAERVPA